MPGRSFVDHQFGGRDLHQHRARPRPEAIPPRPDSGTPHAAHNIALDEHGRTTLEQMTDWLLARRF